MKYYLQFVMMLNDNNIDYYIKGSSAWFANAIDYLIGTDINKDDITCDTIMNYLKEKYKDNIPLLASFLPQNWDICVFASEPLSTRELIYTFLKSMAEDMKKDPRIIPQKRVTRSEKNRDETILNINVNTKDSGADTFIGGYVSLCSEEYKGGHPFADFDDELVCTEQSEDKGVNVGFLVFWVVVYNVSLFGIENRNTFYQNFIDNFLSKTTTILPATILPEGKGVMTRYLNTDGLILNSVYIASSGVDRSIEKGLDIDNIRSGAMTINKFSVYKRLQTLWSLSFNNWNSQQMESLFYFKQYDNIENIIKKNILENYIGENGSYMKFLEHKLIYEYRPVINNIIIDMNYKLSNMKIKGVESAKLFIVGGDAFVRYIPTNDISDIDVKLLITPKESHVGKISWKIKNKIIELVSNILSEYILYLNYTGKFVDKPLFRIRNYDATAEAYPFNLISMDCRGNHDVPEIGVYGYMLDYAILDISIMYNNTKKDTKEYVDMMKCSGKLSLPAYLASYLPQKNNISPILDDLTDASLLPVASSSFLMEEILQRYDNPDSVEGRYFAGKIEKDMSRYLALKNNYTGNVNVKFNVMDPMVWWSMKLVDHIRKTLTYFGCVYSQQFEFMRTEPSGETLHDSPPPRWMNDEGYRYNKKSKTSFSSDKYKFCDKEYFKQDNMNDIRYYIHICSYKSGIGIISDDELKKYMEIFCNAMSRGDRTEYPTFFGNIYTKKIIEDYLR